MSMVSDIQATLRRAMNENKHPKCIKMSAYSMAQLIHALRRNDPDRKHAEVRVKKGMPVVKNRLTHQWEPLQPRVWELEDTKRKIKVSVPLEVSPIILDDSFVIEFDDKPYDRVTVQDEEAELREYFVEHEGAKDMKIIK